MSKKHYLGKTRIIINYNKYISFSTNGESFGGAKRIHVDCLKGFDSVDNVFDFERWSSLFAKLESITDVVLFKLQFWQTVHQFRSEKLFNGMHVGMPKFSMSQPGVTSLSSDTSQSSKINII